MTVDQARWDPSGRPAAGPNRRPRTWPGLAVLVVLVVAVGAGCDGRRSDAGTGATVREETTTTSTTAPADPYAVPEVIDAAYVDRVLAALYKVDGDAARIIVREGEVVPEAANTLRAIYAPDELHAQVDSWGELVGQRFEGLRNPPGDIRRTVNDLRTATPRCIFLQASSDLSMVATDPRPPSVTYLALVPKQPQDDPAGLNPTPWAISLDAVSVNGAPPKDPCAGA